MNEEVRHPSHYTDGGIETIDFIRAKSTPEEFVVYCRLNAIKYLSRAGKKVAPGEDPRVALKRDLEKAETYIAWGVRTARELLTQNPVSARMDSEP